MNSAGTGQTKGLARPGASVLLLALMLLAFARGVWALGAKSLWWDESLSLHRAEQDVASILSGKITLTDNVTTLATIDDHPPLYFLLLAGGVRLWGRSEFALRFLSLAAVVAIVPLLYVTGRRLVDRRAGLAAAALGALSPMYLWYGQEARMYALMTFWGLLSFYAFVRASPASQKTDTSGQPWIWIGVFVFACICVMLTHYLGVLVVGYELALVGFQLFRGRNHRRIRMAVLLGLIVLMAAILAYEVLVLPYGLSPGRNKPGFEFVPLGILLRDVLNSFGPGPSVDVGHWYVLLIDIVFLGLLLLGFARLIRRGSSRAGPSAGWQVAGFLIVPVALVYLFSYVQPVYMNSRHLMFASPAFYLMVGAGLTWLRGRLTLVAALVSMVIVAGMSYSTRNYFSVGPYEKGHHRQWGEYLRDHVRPGDVVVVDPPQIAELYQYYASSDVPWIGLPLLGKSQEETAARLSGLLERYDRVWLAFSHTPPWGDPNRFPESWLNENACRVDYHPFESSNSIILVALYLPGPPLIQQLPQDAQPVQIRYSSSLRLVGYRAVSPIAPGKLAHIQLFWAVDESIRQEASVLLRLVDSEGHLWGQGWQCPFYGLYPMWQWAPGQIVNDEQELSIESGTPPGDYELELMLIDQPATSGCLSPAGQPIRASVVAPELNRRDHVLLGSLGVQAATVAPGLSELGIERRLAVGVEGLTLLGGSVPATESEPGGRVEVRLFWQADLSPLPDMQFHLALVDSAGKVWQEEAIRPAGDRLPTDRWSAGDRLRGQFWLQVPDDAPSGRYRVELEPVPPRRWNSTGSLLHRSRGAVLVDTVDVSAQDTGGTEASAASIPVPTGLGISHPMLATLGGAVRFLGYDLEAQTLEAGEPLSFTLYWQALRQTDRSYTVFAHLLGPANRVIGQQDNEPRGGTYPTTLWQPGEVITDTYSFAVASDVPAGTYPLEVGMYRLQTGKRLAVVDAQGEPVAEDRIVLTEITLLPTPPPSATGVPGAYRIFLPLIEVSH